MNKQTVPIHKIGRVVTGKTPLTGKTEYYNGSIMFITPSEFHNGYWVLKTEKTISENGLKSIKSNSISGISVLVGCIGWDMGNVALCNATCATNQQINSITDIKSDYNPLYIYYWLCTQKNYLFSIASVTRTPILSKSTFEQILVSIPNRSEQDKIVQLLSCLDEKILKNKCINDNLAA